MKIIASETNSSVSYNMMRSELKDKDIGEEYVYGISISDDQNMVAVEDISCDYIAVKKLFELMIEEQLYPEHLYDVVEDFLS